MQYDNATLLYPDGIATGMPLICEPDESLKPIKNYYLGDPDEIKRATETIVRQGERHDILAP